MKITIILLLVINAYSKVFLPKSINNFNHIQSYSKVITKKNLISTMRSFIEKSYPNRFILNDGHERAIKFITTENSSIERHDFTIKTSLIIKKLFDISKYNGSKFYPDLIDELKKKKTLNGSNLSFFMKGKSKKELVLISHFDTLAKDKKSRFNKNMKMPGADYNASGVAILLSIIKNLPRQTPNYSLRIVFSDLSTIGLKGSENFINNYKNRKNILGVINLEMLAHDSKFNDKQKKINNFKAYTPNVELRFVKKFFKYKKKSSKRNLFTIKEHKLFSSDNMPFEKEKIPVITFSQDWENDFNKRYMTQNDFVESINQNTFYSAYTYIYEMTMAYLYL